MPIWLRRFTFSKIKDFYEKKAEAEKEAYEKAQGKQSLVPKGPNIPSYSTKTSPK